MKKILLLCLFSAFPLTIPAYADVIEFLDTEVSVSENLTLLCAYTGQASVYDKKKALEDRLKSWKEICKYDGGCRIKSTDMLTGETSEYYYDDIVNELVTVNKSVESFTKAPCGYSGFYLHRYSNDDLVLTTSKKTTIDISLRIMERKIQKIGEHGEDKYPLLTEVIALQMPTPHDLREIRWFDGDISSRKITLDEYIPYVGNNYFNLRIADVSEDKINNEVMIPEIPKKEEPVEVKEPFKPSDTKTYSFEELKFKKIGDFSVFAKKSANGIMVILWKPDGAVSSGVNKYEIVLRDQAGNEQPIILQKKKPLLFRPTSGMTYILAIEGISKGGTTVAEAMFNVK